jgi:SpoIIAA-like
MIEPMDDLPDGVIGFRADGQITASDYTDVLKPAVDAVIKQGSDVRIVLEFPAWSGFTGGAMWEDMKMGIERLTKWKRIALVTDLDWMRHAVSIFGWMTPGDVKTFSLADRDDALAWAAAS